MRHPISWTSSMAKPHGFHGNGSTIADDGSGRPRTVRTTENIDAVNELVSCQFLWQSVEWYGEIVVHLLDLIKIRSSLFKPMLIVYIS